MSRSVEKLNAFIKLYNNYVEINIKVNTIKQFRCPRQQSRKLFEVELKEQLCFF